jgi:hypothetical protein
MENYFHLIIMLRKLLRKRNYYFETNVNKFKKNKHGHSS